ncbi:MraY family glycosyltransferase [Gaetbulibacter aquiaggeris]|uniref:MraY family glycosyltransferase n=1 Tax=Gaetbulibacter aquiaggeris TaxID=1735373 RepID=A0ABW7MRR4_9FLAO
MMSNLTLASILAVINSFLLVYFIIPKISWVIHMRQLHDNPDERSSHSTAIPTMAGISFFITLIMTLFFIKHFDSDQISLNIIAAITLLFIIGLKDDLVLATPRAKILMETCAILLMLFSSTMQIPTFHGFLGLHEVPVVLTYIAIILMMLTIINAYNLIDGIDGLAAIVAIIIFSIYGLIFFATDLHFYFLLCLSLIGILLAYLNYNFSSTKKIFMGDTGSLIIGFCIGLCTLKFLAMDDAIFNHFSFQPENKLIVIAAILWIPLFDMLRVINVRLLNKKSPFYPDRNHMHHILIDAGISHFQATMLLGLLNYIIVIVIIRLSSIWNSFIMVALLLGLFIAGVFIFYILKKKITLKNQKIKNIKIHIN